MDSNTTASQHLATPCQKKKREVESKLKVHLKVKAKVAQPLSSLDAIQNHMSVRPH